MKKQLLFLVMMILPMVANARWDVRYPDEHYIWYNIDFTNVIAQVTYYTEDYSPYEGNIVIPSEITYSGVKIPVVSIGNSAFKNCKKLTSITIPNSVVEIEEEAFSGCSLLESISMANSLTSIGAYAFSDCINLPSLIISNNVTSIGDYAFKGCSNLASITIPNNVLSIGTKAFYGCERFKNIIIPQSVTSIGDGAFAGCGHLETLSVENGNMQYDSRNNCNAIIATEANTIIAGCVNTIIPDEVTCIGNYAFDGCQGLYSITIPRGVTSIGDCAFYGCWLNDITIPDEVTYIGDGAFFGCPLKSVIIPDKVIYIGKSAFENCSYLKSVNIPDGIINIESNTFRNCKWLTSITIPNSVVTIYGGAFEGCTDLVRVIIGRRVNYIGVSAFAGCYISSCYCYAVNRPEIFSDTFPYDIRTHGKLYVPSQSISQYQSTFTVNWWSKFKTIEALPELIYLVDGDVYKTELPIIGEPIVPEPEPTEEGYTFSGWSEIPDTMPTHDVTVTGSFSVNSYKLTYMVDNKVYKETMYEYGATIIPEPQPEGDYATFEWIDLPQTMPAHDVVVYASYTTGIIEVLMATQRNLRIYSPNGKKLNKLQKGLNILVLDNGTVKKVVVK